MTSLHRHLLWITLAVCITGCAAPRSNQVFNAPPPTQIHQYRVVANDINGKPVGGVDVKATVTNGLAIGIPSPWRCVTDESGSCIPFSIQASRSQGWGNFYNSAAVVEGAKDGYNSAKASASSGGMAPGEVKDVNLRLIRPADYLQDNLANSAAYKDLRARILRFLEIIRMQSSLNDAELTFKGIGIVEFKKKKYLQVRLDSTTSYNDLKLNKYDIGKRIFDGTVRKILDPLNDAIVAPREFYGYDIVIIGHSRDFSAKSLVDNKHEFRFLMPETSVRRYKDKDITGQGLLDASVILLNDERIDLKLQ